MYISATAAYIYIFVDTYCNETLTVNNALPQNSTFTQSILKLLYNSATAAYIYSSNAVPPNSLFPRFLIW